MVKYVTTHDLAPILIKTDIGTDLSPLLPLPGVDLEPDFLGLSRTPKLENLGVCQKIWESTIFLKYDVTMMAVNKFTNYKPR